MKRPCREGVCGASARQEPARTSQSAALHLFAPGLIAAVILCTSSGCATRLHAVHARYFEPDYIVTREFFAEAPQRVVVLPFVSHGGDEADDRPELYRRTFYQHLALRDYETTSLKAFDIAMIGTNQQEQAGTLNLIARTIHAIDVLGMTTVLDLNSLAGSETIPHTAFRDTIAQARQETKADACVIGATRKYGRFYAVVLSSVGISTRVEMWSADTGRLLWGADMKNRNMKAVLTINPFAIPLKLYDVWENSRGHAMGTLAYDVYGSLCETMPYIPRKSDVQVEVMRDDAPLFSSRTCWMLRTAGRAYAGERLTFIREQNGWFQCRRDDATACWVFRDHARLVDDAGNPIEPRADVAKWH